MENVMPVYKKELKTYFYSIIAYVMAAVFMMMMSIFFVISFKTFSNRSMQYMQMQQRMPQQNVIMNLTDWVFTPIMGNMCIILIFTLPLLTMRLYSEERKSGTIELLFTFPIKDWATILGKYLACCTVFLAMMCLTLIYPVLMEAYGSIETGILVSCYLGIILMGMGYIAFGLFISTLTENQIVAAVLTIAGGLFFWIIGMASSPANPILNAVFQTISFLKHFQNFAQGVLNTTDIIYYILFAFFCLFLASKVLESNKWRG